MDQFERETIALRFNSRPCQICHCTGWCGHREIAVELAEIRAVGLDKKSPSAEKVSSRLGKQDFTRSSKLA